jgi:hypothetical protein
VAVSSNFRARLAGVDKRLQDPQVLLDLPANVCRLRRSVVERFRMPELSVT